jgi:hypothetical protein
MFASESVGAFSPMERSSYPSNGRIGAFIDPEGMPRDVPQLSAR